MPCLSNLHASSARGSAWHVLCVARHHSLPSPMPTVATPSRSRKPAAPSARPKRPAKALARATLTLSSKNYSSWSLRGWLMARFAGLDFDEVMVSPDDADVRKELLLLAPSIRVPCLSHEGATVWNTLAIAQYLDEVDPGRAACCPRTASRAPTAARSAAR